MSAKRWTKTQLEEAEQMLWGGKTLQDVADIYQITRERIRQLFPEITKEKKLVKNKINSTMRKKRIKKVFKKDIHGTYASYSNGCRCDECRKANTEYLKVRVVKMREKIKEFKHGYGGYINHKCRCEVCMNKYKEYQQTYQLRRKEK